MFERLRAVNLRRDTFVAPAMASAVAAASIISYLLASRHIWFYADEWSFLLGRSLTHNTIDNLLQPHNEHWSTIPVIVYRVLFSVFGIKSYLVFMIPLMVVHGGVCYLLWNLTRRAGCQCAAQGLRI